MADPHSFFVLTPGHVLTAIESLGLRCTGQVSQLNSVENRVFEVGLEDEAQGSVVAKFYRPQRWTEQQILEEHSFLHHLQNEQIAVSAPIQLNHNQTLADYEGMKFCLFPKVKSRWVDEIQTDQYRQLGTLLARIHAVGQSLVGPHFKRQVIRISFLDELLPLVERFLPSDLSSEYFDVASELLNQLEDALFDCEQGITHGDFHRGNLLYDRGEFTVLDFDDFGRAPRVQDFWLMLPTADVKSQEIDLIIEGYQSLLKFDERELSLIPLLRGYRILFFSAWIVARWKDPTFPKTFGHITQDRYWIEELAKLKECLNTRGQVLLV